MVMVYGRYTGKAEDVSEGCARLLLEEPGGLFTTDPTEKNERVYLYNRRTGEAVDFSVQFLKDHPDLGSDDDTVFSRTPVPLKVQEQAGQIEPPPPPPPPPLDPLPGKGWGDLT